MKIGEDAWHLSGGFCGQFSGKESFFKSLFHVCFFGTKKFARVFQFSLNTKNVQSFSFFWVTFWTSYSPRLQMQRFPDAKVVLTTHPKGAKGWAKSFLALMQVVRLQASDFSWTLSNSLGKNKKRVFPKIMIPPKSAILIGFSIINHPFWGTPIFGNIQKGTTGSKSMGIAAIPFSMIQLQYEGQSGAKPEREHGVLWRLNMMTSKI